MDKGKQYKGAAALNKCSEAELVNKGLKDIFITRNKL